jgi:hypothetical protein
VVRTQNSLLGLQGEVRAGAAGPTAATQGGPEVQRSLPAPLSDTEGVEAVNDLSDDVELAHGGRPVYRKQYTEAEYAIKRARKAENSEGGLEKTSSAS